MKKTNWAHINPGIFSLVVLCSLVFVFSFPRAASATAVIDSFTYVEDIQGGSVYPSVETASLTTNTDQSIVISGKCFSRTGYYLDNYYLPQIVSSGITTFMNMVYYTTGGTPSPPLLCTSGFYSFNLGVLSLGAHIITLFDYITTGMPGPYELKIYKLDFTVYPVGYNPSPTASIAPPNTNIASGGSATLTLSHNAAATTCNIYDANAASWTSVGLSTSYSTGPLTSTNNYTYACKNAVGVWSDSVNGPGNPGYTWVAVTVVAAVPTANITPANTSIAYNGSATFTLTGTNYTYCNLYDSVNGWSTVAPGTITKSSLTSSRYYYYACTDGNVWSDWSVPYPRADVTVSPAANNPPATPSLSYDTPYNPINVNFNFTAQASDPDGDTLKYGFDFTNDGIVDKWMPDTGYVASNVPQSATHQWPDPTSDPHLIRVIAQDSKGALSGWSDPVAVTIYPPFTVTLSPFNPSTVTVGQSSTISFSAQNMKLGGICRASGTATVSWGNQPLPSTIGVQGAYTTGNTVSTAGTYTQSITCTDSSGSATSPTRTLIVNPASCTATTPKNSNCSLPGPTTSGSSADGTCSTNYSGTCNYLCTNGNWSKISNSCAFLPDLTINDTDFISPVSATVGVAATFNSTIRNIGSGSTGTSFSNFMQVTSAPNGGGTITDIVPPVDMAALAAGGANTFSEPYTFASPGTYSLRVCADKTNRNSAGTITESNENNNCGPYTTITVSNPAISGSCSFSPSSGFIGDTFTWSTSGVTGGNGTYTYSWSGTESLSGSSASVTKTYTTSGAKTGSVIVTSGANSQTFNCTNSVTINPCYGQGCIPGGGCNYSSPAQPKITVPSQCCSPTVGVCPTRPTATLSASPTTIDQGQSATLTWGSTGAWQSGTPCVFADGYSGASSGSRSTGALNSPGTPTYQVICSGAGGDSLPAFAPIEVLAPNATISANPTRVSAGGGLSTISWSASGVKSCVVTGPGVSASGNANGSHDFSTGSPRSVPISGQSTFTITCQTNDPSKPKTNSVTVNVLTSFQEF